MAQRSTSTVLEDDTGRCLADALSAVTGEPPDSSSLVLVSAPGSTGPAELRARLAAEAARRGGRLVHLRAANPDLVSFASLDGLLDTLVPLVAAEAPEVLHPIAAELEHLRPHLRPILPGRPAQRPLTAIALTPSERRSHRESEQVFRVVTALCRLVIEGQRRCPTLAGGPLVLWCDGAELADRPSLVTLRRLARWARSAQAPLLLITGFADTGFADTGAAPATIDARLDWSGQHAALVTTMRTLLADRLIRLPDEGDPMPPTPAPPMPVLQPPPLAGDGPRPSRVGAALRLLAAGDLEAGCAAALGALRQAVFDLNLDTVTRLAAAVITALPDPDTPGFDQQRFRHHWEREHQDGYVALEFAVGDLSRPRDLLIASWKAAALAHTFLERHEVALDCYRQAHELADDPVMQAQLSMYLALLSGKRLNRVEEAQELLAAGFAAIDGREDPAAILERGWLLNVSALMAFQTGRHSEAMALVKRGVAVIRPVHTSEAAHLKINLLSNISVLLEALGHLDQALRVWEVFSRQLGNANEVFAKHYLFRAGGLQLKAGQLEPALHSYEQSYAQARLVEDGFHAEIAAAAAGYVAYRLGRWDTADGWYAASAGRLVELGDLDRLPATLGAQALAAARAGRWQDAATLLDQAELLAGAHSGPAAPGRHLLLDGTDEAWSEWEQAALSAPSTKLNRPFDLIQVPSQVPAGDPVRRGDGERS